MVSKEEILETTKSVIEELFDVSPDEISLSTHLYTDIDIDSLDAIDLAASLSKKANIKLVEEDMREIRTIGDIVEIGFKKLNP